MQGKPENWITAAGLDKLQQELTDLQRFERPKIVQEVADAAALGDRSENAEYIYGKRRLREIDRRIRFLNSRISQLSVVTYQPQFENVVNFGAWVHLEDEDGNRSKYQLVGADEFDVELGLVSVASPMGRALLGKQVDDWVTVKRPRGDKDFVILHICYNNTL